MREPLFRKVRAQTPSISPTAELQIQAQTGSLFTPQLEDLHKKTSTISGGGEMHARYRPPQNFTFKRKGFLYYYLHVHPPRNPP